MIPKVIHYCWFGGNPLPESTKRYIESWKKFCPDYEIKEWNESNFDVHCNDFISEAYKARRWAYVSDVARMYVLVNNGGVYFDTDVEVINPIDHLLEYEAFTAFESKYQIGMGILGCVKGQPMFAELLKHYENACFKKPDGTFDTSVIGRRFKEICLKYGFVPDNTLQTVNGLTILPKDYFYPSDPITKEFKITENTLTIHYYDASWVSPVDIYGRTQQDKFKFIPKRFRPGFTRMIGMLKFDGLSLVSLLFKEKTDNLFIQFFRYCFVGGLAFLVDYGLLFLLSDKFGLHYLLSACIAFIAGLIVNYIISTFWVFSESKFKDKRKEFAIFSIIGIIGLALTEGLMWLFTGAIGLHYMLSKIVTAALVLLWNFLARKIILFTK